MASEGGSTPLTYIVTGSASGIGAATRTRLESAGHTVIGVDLRDAEVEADLSDPDVRPRAVEDLLARCGGRLHGVVTSAGVGDAETERIVGVNYFGTVELLEGLRPALATSGAGRAVALSSALSTLVPVPPGLVERCLRGNEQAARELATNHPDNRLSVYVATKVAVARWVRRRAPAPEWAGAGIRLNAIAPGGVVTPLLDHVQVHEQLTGHPTGGSVSPDMIASWIELMLGEQAEFLCGAVVFVDGGIDAQFRPDAWPAPPPWQDAAPPDPEPQGWVSRVLTRRGRRTPGSRR